LKVGKRWLAVGSRKEAVGGWRLEVGSRQFAFEG